MGHVLLLEDNVAVAKATSLVLSRTVGCEVTSVASVAEATRLLKGSRFGLMVSDVMLPDGDGVEFAAQVRSSWGLPVVLMTARSEPRVRERAARAGVVAFLPKPVGVEELRRTVAAILAGGDELCGAAG